MKIVKKILLWIATTFCLLMSILFFAMRNDPLAAGNDGGKLLLVIAVCFLFLACISGWYAIDVRGKQRTKQRKNLEEYRNGRIQELMKMTSLPVVESPISVLLKAGEICHFQSNAYIIQFKEQIVGYTGSSGGVSVRVTKGITLRSGNSRGKPIREKVVKSFPGVFTMTNRRFIMTGEKGFEYPISKLTAIEPWNEFEGIILQFCKSHYILTMLEPYTIPKILELLEKQEA